MLKHAVEWGYIRTYPAMKVRYPTVTRKQMDLLKPDEVRDFLSKEVDHQRYTFFLTTICGGLRESEVIGARGRDLNWRSGQYYVRQQWTRPNPGVPAHFEEPKTKSSVSPVDLAPECLEALKVHKANQAEDRLTAGEKWEDNDLIFCLPNGRPLDHWNVVKRWFRPALTEAELRMVRFHDLRHTCASILIDNNENPKYIQKQMRHASINMTFDTYGHLFEDKNPESAARFGSSIFGSRRSKKYLRSGEKSG
jgi:integrase